jgi:hypothetical protein
MVPGAPWTIRGENARGISQLDLDRQEDSRFGPGGASVNVFESNMPIELNLARKALNEFRAEARYVSPCQKDPALYDPRPDFEKRNANVETPKEYETRLLTAEEGCLNCRAFVPCLAVAERISIETPEIQGMVAGSLFDNSLTGRKVAANLTLRGVVEC